MDAELLIILNKYLEEIPINKGKDIKIIDIKPKTKGLYVSYVINNNIQRFGRTIYYKELL